MKDLVCSQCGAPGNDPDKRCEHSAMRSYCIIPLRDYRRKELMRKLGIIKLLKLIQRLDFDTFQWTMVSILIAILCMLGLSIYYNQTLQHAWGSDAMRAWFDKPFSKATLGDMFMLLIPIWLAISARK